MTTTSLATPSVPATPGDLTQRDLRDLRERRLELRAEQVRSRYVSRLLRARLDLAVAAAVGSNPQEQVSEWPEALPVPPSDEEVAGLLRHPAGDLGHHLASLRDALARMAGYEEALGRECEASTEQLVHALVRSPRSCLEPVPARPARRRTASEPSGS